MADETSTRYRIVTGSEFARVHKALLVIDKDLAKQFRKALRDTLKGSVKKVQEAALAIEAHGRDHSGLRKRIAKGVKIKATRSASTFRVVTSMTNPSEAALPRGMDASFAGGFRHPVFGDPENWVVQHGDPWFMDTMSDQQDELRDAMEKVLYAAARLVKDAGL